MEGGSNQGIGKGTHPWGLHSGDEELGSVGVGTGVGHGEETGAVVEQLEVLVWGRWRQSVIESEGRD
jgi:hypothetical protein